MDLPSPRGDVILICSSLFKEMCYPYHAGGSKLVPDKWDDHEN